MLLQHFVQDSFLSGFQIHKKNVLAVTQRSSKPIEIVIGAFDTNQTTFPCAEAKYNQGQKDERRPANN